MPAATVVIAGAALSIGIANAEVENAQGLEQLAAIESLVAMENARLLGKLPHTHFSNQTENRKFKEAVRQIEKLLGRKLTKDQIERLHREISKGGYDWKTIIEIGLGLFS